MINSYITVMETHREFHRAYAFIPTEQCPDWITWCGSGSLDKLCYE